MVDGLSYRIVKFIFLYHKFFLMTKILIVDRNERFLCVLSQVLTTRNYFVQSVSSGKACLEMLTKEDFDLIFLEIASKKVISKHVK